MLKLRLLLTSLVLMLAGASLASAQVIPTIEVGERVLVNITSAGQSFAYEFNNEAESDTTLFVTYLGEPFPFVTEWYDSNGALLWYVPVSEAGAGPALRLPPDAITIIISADGDATGRATVSLGVDAPSDLPFDGGEDMGMGEDGGVVLPESGTWTIHYIDHENNCPNDILFENIWMPADGSTHPLTFSGTAEDLGLELHRLVAPQEIADEPSFFERYADEMPNTWVVTPGIQGAPYEYRYTVSAPDYVQIEYTERLALSDCELYARYEMMLTDAGTGSNTTPSATGLFADLSTWSTSGDATDVSLTFDDPFAPDGALCASDRSTGETWYFAASPDVVAQVNANGGGVLEYDLKLNQNSEIYDDYDVILTVGNGIILVYEYQYYPSTDDWMHYQIPLAAGTGWLDPDGGMPTDDDALFTQMMADVTQIEIRGEFQSGSDRGCIANVSFAPFGG